jgi:hypothetical protein
MLPSQTRASLENQSAVSRSVSEVGGSSSGHLHFGLFAVPFNLEAGENAAPRSMAGGLHARPGASRAVRDVLDVASRIEAWAAHGAREVQDSHAQKRSMDIPKQPPKQLIQDVLDGVCCVEFMSPLAKPGTKTARMGGVPSPVGG